MDNANIELQELQKQLILLKLKKRTIDTIKQIREIKRAIVRIKHNSN